MKRAPPISIGAPTLIFTMMKQPLKISLRGYWSIHLVNFRKNVELTWFNRSLGIYQSENSWSASEVTYYLQSERISCKSCAVCWLLIHCLNLNC